MTLEIIDNRLLAHFTAALASAPLDKLAAVQKLNLEVDYFQFYKSVSSVYSSKIEGEDIEFDSYYKHKFLHIPFQPDYTRKADDLYAAYDFIDNHQLNLENIKQAHQLITRNMLPASGQGKIRSSPMFVLNKNDQIDYEAADPHLVPGDLAKLFRDINTLLQENLNQYEVFYYASYIHLVFVKIHPFQDGNGRTARLLEKWFLIEKIGQQAAAIQLEKNYFLQLNAYYNNIKKIGLEYSQLDYQKSLDFLLMTARWVESQD